MAGHPLPRRGLPALLPFLGVGGAQAAHATGPEADWDWLRGRFLAAEGRMVPATRPEATESGFQAIGLLAALHANDLPRFERILAWSLATLRRPDDHLWAWRREEGPGDSNNSTHADLMAAWALVQASERWRRADLRRLGQSMAQDILSRCLLPGGPPLLLPAAGGFFNPRRGVLSPGSLVLPAFPALAQAAPDRRWDYVRAEALSLIRRARFGPWLLPPDWLELDRASGRLTLATGWPPRFSAIAAGAVLHLCWAGLGRDPPVAAALAFWEGQGEIPAWADLREGRVAPQPGHAGLRAVAKLAEAASLGRGTMDSLPVLSDAEDEEAAGLVLLSRLAWREIGLSRRGE
ncbi:glycosyl hydrolase family 8 [Roseococcus thiosulfatophilus]|uniref:glycosyl hydrolase family 8 n=1 Tax=Roseococcus thiosulfatophilus TaxID=35813 RepID=UPI001A9004F2|nr:glycosyl hydrolase family 8 [Roseococcus thiosulfatophilus]